MNTIYNAASFRASHWWPRLGPEVQNVFDVVTRVYAFKVSQHVLEELIAWESVPDDPIFRLVFPQRGMLSRDAFDRISAALEARCSDQEIEGIARSLRSEQNPHPGAQLRNIPFYEGAPIQSIQHKYRESVLFFPSGGQTCHSYCTYCFRWAQFVQAETLRFSGRDTAQLRDYIGAMPDVTDVIVTGGDPAILPTSRFEELVDALLPLAQSRTLRLRLGTKAPIYHPDRFLAGDEGRRLLTLFARSREQGLPVTLMLHATHPRELQAAATRRALAALHPVVQSIRLQSPIVRGINDDAGTWSQLLSLSVDLGCIPYYMFIPRDTGPSRHFAVTLERALTVYRESMARVTGLARTLRGPILSDDDGKLELIDIERGATGSAFVMRLHQHRDPLRIGELIRLPFDANATWVSACQAAPAVVPAVVPAVAPAVVPAVAPAVRGLIVPTERRAPSAPPARNAPRDRGSRQAVAARDERARDKMSRMP